MSEQYHPSRQRVTDQERGRRAWENVCIVEKLDKNEVKKKYRTQARQFAALVRTNGLAQTLAFLCAKANLKSKEKPKDEERAMRLILSHVNAAIWSLLEPSRQVSEVADTSLLEHLLQQPSMIHRQATVEALAFGRWLSRFAEAELPSDDEQS